jgi:integrase
VVLTREEVQAVLAHLDGVQWIMAMLLYGAGLRLMECVRLRVKDLDFDSRHITVREGKGQKDRVTMLPKVVHLPLQRHLDTVRVLPPHDLADGFGDVYLPYALGRKYPGARKAWGWQYVFPARQRSRDPPTGNIRRHHLDEKSLQRAVKKAIHAARVHKPASCHTFRHYAAH